MSDLINKVANSGIISIDLEEFYQAGERVLFDIKPFLFQELLLKEKDFRESIKSTNWESYSGKYVGIICSSDAIVPTWAFMLIALALKPHAKAVFFGNLAEMEVLLFAEKLKSIDLEQYRDARVVIKGCADKPVPTNAFVQLAALLQPYVKSIMYGEPCSTVPLFKAKSQ